MPNAKTIGLRIKKARIDLEMSQESLGKAIGVTRQAVCNYETGDSVPGDDMKLKLAEVLGQDIVGLFYADHVNKKNTCSQ